VAIYEDPSGPGTSTRLVTKASPADRAATAPRPVAFFAPDRPGIAWRPVYEQYDAAHGQTLLVPASGQVQEHTGARPLFYVLPADVKDYTAATVPLYEYREDGSARRFYSVEAPATTARSRLTPTLLGRVWRNPARSRTW
jgi:hypothetical protein